MEELKDIKEASETSSTSESKYEKKNIILIEKALELLNQEKVDYEKLLICCKELLDIGVLDLDIQDGLLDENAFEIIEKENSNPIFIRNLLNKISIINFVWKGSKGNIKQFHDILLQLNILFSFIYRNQKDEQGGVDYVLLTSIQDNIYENVVKKGIQCFNKNYSFDENYLSPNKTKEQIGLVYQENTISKLTSLLNGKEQILPSIMYYLKYNSSKDLFKKNIFNNPKNFLELNHEEKSFYGFNEIDFSFFLKENISIPQNFIYNKVKEKTKNEFIEYNPMEQSCILLPKDTNIFIEIKTNITTLEGKSIKNIADRFYESYKNIAYDQVQKKFIQEEKAYYLLYNNNRDDAYGLLKNNIFIEKNKEVEIQYNSGYVQISSLVSLQNNIRVINNKMTEQEKQIKDLKEKFDEKNEEIKDLKEKFEEYKKAKEYEKEILEKKVEEIMKKTEKFKMDGLKDKIVGCQINLTTITKVLNTALEKQNMKIFSYYSLLNEKYEKAANLILDNKIINLCNKLIGTSFETNQEKQDFLELIDLLSNIKNNTIAKDYYESFRQCLIGPHWKNGLKPQNFGKIDLFSKSELISDILKNIIKFISLLDIYEDLETHFFGAILYYASKIPDPEFYSSFYLYVDVDNVKATIINFIKYLNKENCSEFIIQLKKGK